MVIYIHVNQYPVEFAYFWHIKLFFRSANLHKKIGFKHWGKSALTPHPSYPSSALSAIVAPWHIPLAPSAATYFPLPTLKAPPSQMRRIHPVSAPPGYGLDTERIRRGYGGDTEQMPTRGY